MNDEQEIRAVYRALITGWNQRDASAMAELLTDYGVLIGFDGTLHAGPHTVREELSRIFAAHPTPPYVAKVRNVRLLTPDAAILTAVAGMAPAAKGDLVPALNAVQTLTVVRREGRWRVALFQNTPAAYHGRPNLVDELTEELRQVWRNEADDSATCRTQAH